MGVTVRQKGKKWYVFITHRGRRQAKAVGDRRAAESVASKLRAKLALGDFQIEDGERPPIFKEYAERWLESYVKVHCRPSTYVGYRRVLDRYAYPRFGGKPLPEVSREDLKAVIGDMGTMGLSKSSIKAAVAPIRELYNHAIDDGHQLQNPAARMGRLLKDKADRRLKITPLSAEEVQRLLDAAGDYDRSRAGNRFREVLPSV